MIRLTMPPPLPEIPGVEHEYLDLPTGVRLHVALAGPPDAPRVLALHGWPQHWWCWRRVIAELGDDVRIACPDLRGFGWSGWPDDGELSTNRFADDALATLDALGWDRAVLAGHDWGGVTGYKLALRAPERLDGMVVLGAPHPWQPPERMLRNGYRFAYQLPLATPFLGSALMRDGRFATFVLKSAGPGDLFSEEEREVYLAPLRDGTAAAATERLYRSFLTRELPKLAKQPPPGRLEVPTRLLFGSREPLGTDLAKGLERHGDDATVEYLEGCGHWVPEERPAVVAERIRALLA
jgi:pimeloyl-ACP methyl ester carboxylesterase